MKKILSIGNLFVKRIGLVAILLATIGVGDVWAYAKSTVEATANPSSGAGTAQVSKSSTSGFAASETQTTGGFLTTSATHTYYLKATTTSAAWLWKGWYNNGVLAVSAQTSNIQVRGTASTLGGESYTYTATWLQPKVTGTTAGEDGGTNIKKYVFGPYTDPNVGSETRDVVFTLESNESGLIAKDGTVPTQHFTEALSGSWTANTFVKNSSDFPGVDKSSYTYNVTYKLSGVHGTSVTADIKVTSKYGGSNCTARLVATEDYMPYFNYAYEEYNYTPDDPLAEGQFLTQTFNVSKNCYAANHGVWSVSLPADAASKGFTLQSAANEPNAVVKFEALQGMNKADITTTLTAVCTYTDASGTKLTYNQTILLSGDVGKVITIDGAEINTMTFDIDYAASGESTQTLPFMTTLTGLTTTSSNLPADDFITYTTWVAGLTEVSTTVKHNLTPGQYTPSIKYSYNSDEVYSILNIVANIRLAKPVVTATIGMGQKIQLDWQDIYGASSYIVKSGETVLATILSDGGTLKSTCAITNIAGKQLITGVEYSFTVTAVYESNTFGNRTSDVVKVTPTAPKSITSETELDIWTGTENNGSYPYSYKRKVDLSAAFKDGVAAFDKLFIFGMTSGDANDIITTPSSTTNSNAVTPCYIYNKSGNDYVLNKTIGNVNVATKPSEFDITASGQKIYFTGYAPYVSCGSTWGENGVFLFSGRENATKTIDLYLDNLQIYARPKSESGNVVPTRLFELEADKVFDFYTDEDVDFQVLGGVHAYIFTQGSGSVFCFQSTSTNSNVFKPTIHLKNNNILQSTQGVTVIVKSSLVSSMATGLPATQHSAPIQILLKGKDTAEDSKTKLVIDDQWGETERNTNGILNLAVSDARPAPTIDLGNQHSELEINGGQLFLSNSFNSSKSYYVSYAISYRKKEMMEGLGRIYGLGDDQPEGVVKFNDGSINCKPISPSVYNANQDAKDRFALLFHNAESMKCPKNTTIDGGTFNCNVLSCTASASKGSSPTNSAKQPVCLVTIPVDSINPTNRTAVLSNDWKQYASQNGATDAVLASDYTYGISSLQPTYVEDEARNEVYLMLPSNNVCFKEVINTPWVVSMPKMNISGVPVGGDANVEFSNSIDEEGLTTVKMTHKLLYLEIDDILLSTLDYYSNNSGISISLADGGEEYEITNAKRYAIYDKLYMMIPVIANKWKLFVPPFDISNVYVIESVTEKELHEMYGSTKIEGSNISDARTFQAYRNIDLLYDWMWSVDKYDEDVWPNTTLTLNPNNEQGKGDGVFEKWMSRYVGDNKPVIEQLYHYALNGNYPNDISCWDANFYLYKADDTKWTINEEGLNATWEEVNTISKPRNMAGDNNIIMQKGDVYSLCFPYSIYNDGSHDPETTWDYWTGKYILFEGYAVDDIDSDGNGIADTKGQMLSGKSSDWDDVELTQTILNEYTEDFSVSLRGNSTFARINVEIENAYTLNVNVFEPGGTLLYPSEGFMLANGIPEREGMPARRIQTINPFTGEITYREETPTSLPTIAGNSKMFVYNIEGGLGIVPVVPQQVTIYNASGQVVISQFINDEIRISLPAGFYLISGTQDQFKAVVK